MERVERKRLSMAIDPEHIKNIAIRAAYGSADILKKHMGRLDRIGEKAPGDLVTDADVESEKNIIETIRNAFPDHGIHAEESRNEKDPGKAFTWIIDPLDGTTNFAHQVPFFSISIAFAASGEILAGVVLHAVSGELFTAVKNKGAQLNGHDIRVSRCGSLSGALLVTGFPYDAKQNPRPYMARYEKMLGAAQGVRRLGSAALDLCYVACGRFDGFWEERLHPWDTAAGLLIAKEAGARVTDFSGAPYDIDKTEILATNGLVHEEMRTIIQS